MDKCKSEQHFKCTKHQQVFFSAQAMQDHVRGKCHQKNIITIDSTDKLGDRLDTMIEDVIKARKRGRLREKIK